MTADHQRGLTPRELAGILRVSPDKVLGWIRAGELGALNTSSAMCRKPRYVVLPRHLEEFERRRQVTAAPKRDRRKTRSVSVDYYPD